MAGFFDFIKKSSNQSTVKTTQVIPPPATAPPSASGVADSGFAVPVDHSQSYSGIGHPSSGSAYSGIGTPPGRPVPTEAKAPTASAPATRPPNASDRPTGASLNSNLNDKKRSDLDLMTHLTQRSNRVFLSAQTKAKELQSELIDSEHLLHGLLSDGEIYKLLVDLKLQPQLVEEELAKVYKKGSRLQLPQMAPRVKRIIDNSLVVARKLGFEFISPEHILLALYEEGEGAGARILAKLGLKKEELNKKILGKKEGLEEQDATQGRQAKKSALEQYTIDMTAKAAQGLLDPVVERYDTIERVIHILSRRTKNNPALVGEAGVGKTAIVEGLAEKIVAKQVPEPLLNRRILSLDLMSLLAGASHRGDFEERMKDLIEEVKASKGQIILFIDEIHNIMGAGGNEGTSDAANFLKPALSRGEMQVIGATTLTEYRKYIEKDPALERRFQPVIVPEPNEEQAIKMLKAIKGKYEAFHRVQIPDEAIDAAVRLSKRYVGDRFLPDKAVDLIDEAASAVRLPMISLPEEIRSLETRVAELNQELKESEKSTDQVRARILRSKIADIQTQLNDKKEEYNLRKSQTTTAVSGEIIKEIVSRWTGIPIAKISGSEMEKLSHLEEIMHRRLIGQDEAVAAVSQAIRRGRAGLKSTQRPIGSFVFLGPTGTGKTELAKTLADILFGQEEAMVRFDMTEYMEKHEVAKLLGAPPGYVGYEEGGKLTEAVRRKPYSVVLFDEIEKAHPDIFNILLQILDDGRLTDNKGHTISFKNTVVICTSNIGSPIIQQELMKAGKSEIEEPPVLSTYTFSPRGREMLTIGNKIFEKDGQTGKWNEKMLLDYFSGQEIEADAVGTKIDFPIHGFDTHAISASGVEMITKGKTAYMRNSTTGKTWKTATLVNLFKDNVVINALPDAPDEQLPTAMLKTHAFSPDDKEIVTHKDRYWVREMNGKNWQTGLLKDYFKDSAVAGGNFPTAYWDIHAFSPAGIEFVVVADTIWYREAKTNQWLMKPIQQYFGQDFPLEKQIQEKQRVDDEVQKKQFVQLRTKVMAELHKFFRPELINRFDEVILFEPLRFSQMKAIVKLQLKSVQKALEEQDMGFSYSEAALKEIVRAGFDPVFGARPLRRAIQKLVENPISSLIIEKKMAAGDQVTVDFQGDGFVFNVERLVIVDKSPSQTVETKQYQCRQCQTVFSTKVYPNATIICPKCVSRAVTVVEPKKTPEDQINPPSSPSSSGSDSEAPAAQAKKIVN
ncbi:AAA family ATPase [Patescibacteria group bacterium]|nr:AAA family ATPase [Patescibacteria group bacterium]MCL5091398.1 AAA family ATPase [Patescibacteria group bacterium]